MGLGPGPALRLERSTAVGHQVAQPKRLIQSRSLVLTRRFVDLSIYLENDVLSAHVPASMQPRRRPMW